MEKINFFIPNVTFTKSVNESGKEEYLFEGVASDDSEDADKEILEPSGFDFDNFVRAGFINYNHNAKNDPTAIVGEPISAFVEGNKWKVRGKIYGDSKVGRGIVELDQTLRNSNSNRKLGFSIEGVPILRDNVNPRRIKKALITGLAITPCPKNSNTMFSLIKGNYESEYVEHDFELIKGLGKDVDYLLDIEDENKRITVDKNFNVKIKSLTASGNGSQLKKESLEGGVKNVTFGDIKKSATIIVEAHKLGIVSDDILEKARKAVDGEIMKRKNGLYVKENGKWVKKAIGKKIVDILDQDELKRNNKIMNN